MRRFLPLAFSFLTLFPLCATAYAVIDVSTLATSGTGTSGSPWAGWESSLNAKPANTQMYFPAGYYTQSTRIDLKQGWVIRGDGKDASYVKSSMSGTAFRAPFSLATSNQTHTAIRDLCIWNTNSSNNGSGYLDVAGGLVELVNVKIQGFRFGASFIQSEIVTVARCDFEFQTEAGIWIVNNGDYNTTYADLDYSTAGSDITNFISVQGCQFNDANGVTQILDDGGYTHEFTNNNYNGGTMAIRMAGVVNGRVTTSEFEAQSGDIALLTYFAKHSGSSTGIGPNGTITFDEGLFAPTSTNACIITDSVETLVLIANYFSSSQPAIKNGSNANTIVNIRSRNSNTALLDSDPTRLIDLGSDLTTGNLRMNTNLQLAKAGSGLQIKEGTNARMGQAILSGGTKTVSNTSVTANTRIFLSRVTAGTSPGELSYTISSGTNFTISSTQAGDNGTVNWLLIEAP